MKKIKAEFAIKWFEYQKTRSMMPVTIAMYDTAIASLRAQQEAEKNDPLKLEADRDAWKRRAEAAERDIRKMLIGNGSCCYCGNFATDKCSWESCPDVATWRGPCAENGGAEDAE